MKREQTILVPEETVMLSAGAQGPTVVLWGLAESTAPLASYRVMLIATGEPCDDVKLSRWRHVGTVTTQQSEVVHVFAPLVLSGLLD